MDGSTEKARDNITQYGIFGTGSADIPPVFILSVDMPRPTWIRRDPLQWLLRDQGVWGNRAVGFFTRGKKIEL